MILMGKKLQIAILLFTALFVLTSSSHPIKLTSSVIRYDKKTTVMKMECKVFIDDFAPAISAGLEKNILDEKVTKDDIKGIENYFIKNYRVYLNGKKLNLKFVNQQSKDNVMTLSFSIDNKSVIKKGDHFKVENELLFEKFPDIQSNWVTLQMPPFLKNYNYECNFENYSLIRTF